MKKRLFLFSCFAVVFAFLLLNTLSAVTDEPVVKETDLPLVLSDLLFGKNTDPQAALSNLEEKDFPLALTACEVLHHKALHQDIKVSPESIEAFKVLLQKRIESSQTVSFKPTPACVQKIPAHEIIIEGKHLTVPEHYLAPVKFAITGFSPTGEAGTLLPDIQVFFTGGKAPITARIFLDGKEIVSKSVKNSFLFRPRLMVADLLKIGAHKVDAKLSDAVNEIASVSWSFSIGLKPGSTGSIPDSAKVIASFPIDCFTLFPGAAFNGKVEMTILEAPDGKRFFQYSMVNAYGDKTTVTDLFLLSHFLKKRRLDESLIISPKVPCLFAGIPLKFSYTYTGPGTILETNWIFNGAMHSGETFDLIYPKAALGLRCHLKVKIPSPDPDPIYSETYVDTSKTLHQMFITNTHESIRQWIPFRPNGTSLDVESIQRVYWDIPGDNFPGGYFYEGDEFHPGQTGSLKVVRARLKQMAGDANPAMVSPGASMTTLIFREPGFAEFVDDIAFTFTWGDEKYDWAFTPAESSLFAAFPYQAQTHFEIMPKGIISGTKRNIKVKDYTVKIKDEQRVFSKPADLSMNPPWILAQSVLFPNSKPLAFPKLQPIFVVKNPKVATLETDDGFSTQLEYVPSMSPGPNFPLKVYFSLLFWDARQDYDPDLLINWLLPGSEWMNIPAYPSPAELVQVDLEPKNPETEEGKKIDFKAIIVPKPGFGDGRITADGGTITLLNGYEAQAVSEFGWSALSPNQTPDEHGTSLNFSFVPNKGTGTYAINATTQLKAKEKDTGGVVDVTGVGSTTVKVEEGLKIVFPTNDFIFPQGATIEIRTNQDDSPQQWKEIVWSLNGQPWKPTDGTIPAKLFLEKAVPITIKASIFAAGNVEISHQVTFDVKPVKITITPARLVTLYPASSTIPLSLRVEFAGKTFDKVNDPISLGNNLQAQITGIAWQPFLQPDNVLELTELDKNPFKPIAQFKGMGAATLLATVTMNIEKNQTPATTTQKTNKNGGLGQNISLPFTRADLWSVEPPIWDAAFLKELPDKAIASAGRTFNPTSGAFQALGKTHSWSNTKGLTEPIELFPALESKTVEHPKASSLSFSWKTSENQMSDKTPFVAAFKQEGNVDVTISTALYFGSDGPISFQTLLCQVTVSDLNKLILTRVEPSSFSMTIGETKEIYFVIEPTNAVPTVFSSPESNLKTKGIPLLDNAYFVVLDKIEWFPTINSSKYSESQSYEFSPTKVGLFTGKARGWLKLFEGTKRGEDYWNYAYDESISCDVKDISLNFYVNGKPIGDFPIYLGEKITLSFDASPKLKNIQWSGPTLVKSHQPNNLLSWPEFLKEDDLKKESISFYICDFPETTSRKRIEFSGEYGNYKKQDVVLIDYKRPVFVNFKSDPKQPVVSRIAHGQDFGRWYLGYSQVPWTDPSADPKDQIEIFPIIKNDTGCDFDFSTVQLVFNHHTRKIKKLPNESWLTDLALGNWVDKYSIYGEMKAIPSSPDEKELESLFGDSPRAYLDAIQPEKEVYSLSALASYTLFFQAKPSGKDAIYCPIKALEWGWYGDAEKTETGNIWSKKGEPQFIPPSIKELTTFPIWNNCATENYPGWE